MENRQRVGDLTPSTEDPITAKEARILLRCSLSQVYALFDEGELAGFRVGRSIRIHAESVQEYKTRNTNQPKQHPAETPPRPRKRISPAEHRPFRHLR
jgi:excisionase family DNA binding protein